MQQRTSAGRREILLIACLLSTASAGADQFDAARRVIRDAMYSENLPSVAVAASRKDKVIWEEAFGFADLERKRQATPRTLYSLASISKPITATALMTLVERGALHLDRPIDDYLGAVKLTAHVGDAKDATVRRVANHTAGLPIHYQFFYEDEPRRRPPRDESIALHGHLMSGPGEAYIYSNFGYGLLDDVIERVSGRSYGEYLRMAVFEPLGMKDSAVDARPATGVDVAVRYANDRSPLPFYTFDAPGASAVFASAHDLLRFGMFHLGDAPADMRPILSDASRKVMQTPGDYIGKRRGESGGYGIGWALGKRHGLDTVSHTGGMAGVSTSLLLIPSQDIAIVVLINAESSRTREIENSIASTLLPQFADAAREFKPEKDLIGCWLGFVKLPERQLPVEITIGRDGRAQVRIDNRAPVDVAHVDTVEDMLWLEHVPEKLDLPRFERHPTELQFGLKRRGDVLSGQATTMSRTLPDRVGDAVSFWITLQRTAK